MLAQPTEEDERTIEPTSMPRNIYSPDNEWIDLDNFRDRCNFDFGETEIYHNANDDSNNFSVRDIN